LKINREEYTVKLKTNRSKIYIDATVALINEDLPGVINFIAFVITTGLFCTLIAYTIFVGGNMDSEFRLGIGIIVSFFLWLVLTSGIVEQLLVTLIYVFCYVYIEQIFCVNPIPLQWSVTVASVMHLTMLAFVRPVIRKIRKDIRECTAIYKNSKIVD
jgi:hypothetical protein